MAAAGLEPLGNVIGINLCPGNSSCKIQFNHTWWRTFSLCVVCCDFPGRPKKLICLRCRRRGESGERRGTVAGYIDNFTSCNWCSIRLECNCKWGKNNLNETIVKRRATAMQHVICRTASSLATSAQSKGKKMNGGGVTMALLHFLSRTHCPCSLLSSPIWITFEPSPLSLLNISCRR